ncbi:MAG: hypothetical protein ACRC7S_18610 [Cetobacterium sp.]
MAAIITKEDKMVKLNKVVCTACGKAKAQARDFYLSHSDLYKHNGGRMTVCKECLVDRYQIYMNKYEDEIKAIYHLCMNFDIYFSKELVESAYKQDNRNNNNDSILKTYLTKVNSLMQYKGMNSISSDYIVLDSDIIKEIEEKYKQESEEVEIEDEEKKITREIRKRWGREYSDEECLLLEEYYEDYFDNYNHDNDYAKLDIVKEVCGLRLIVSRAKRDRDNKTIKEFTSLISQRMADAELKPSQQKKIGEADDDMYSRKLKVLERTKPVREVLDEYRDVDEFWKYLNKHMIKPFAMALGLAKGEYNIEDGSNNIVIDDKLKNELGDIDEN